jgi:putative flippase GtrA
MLSYLFQLYKDLKNLKQRASVVGLALATREVLQPNSSKSWQFTKYMIIGLTTVLVFYVSYETFRVISDSLIPNGFQQDRLLFNLVGITFAFIPSNFYAYHTNRRLVFTACKNESRKEFALFTAGAALTFIACQFTAGLLIQFTAINDFIVTLTVISVSTIVNYFFRKFYVFDD